MIIGKADLKNYLGIEGNARDERIADIAEGVCTWVSKETGRSWDGAETFTERYAGTGTNFLVLRHYPVTGITSVTVDGVLVDHTDTDEIELDADHGILIRVPECWARTTLKRDITVVYSAGESAPSDLKLAALQLGAYMHRSEGRRRIESGDSAYELINSLARELPGVAEVISRYTDSAKGLVNVS